MSKEQHNKKKSQKRRMSAGKKLFSICEIYVFAVKSFRSFKYIQRGRKANIFDEKFQERIMLAVTSVNNCPLCSYAHTEMALKTGMNDDEIKSLLSGEFPNIPDDELKAVLFAQYYADVRGKPNKDAWEKIVKEYGIDKAECILAAARIMMFGNALGIPIGSIRNHLKGKKGDSRSSILYEMMFVIALLPIILIALLQALLLNLFKAPIIKFN